MLTKATVIIFILSICLSEGSTPCPSPCTCTDSGREVDCSGKGLSETPELHDSVIVLDLSSNNISVAMPPFSSDWASNLKFLYLSNNRIKDIKYDFQGLLDLTQVYLDYNLITVIDKRAFEGNTELRKLTLNGNQLDLSETTDFLVVPSLGAIELDNCSISYLPISFFQSMTDLFLIRLSNNKIEQLDRQLFLNLKKLRYLHLEGNQIKRIVPDIFKTSSKLQWLDLSSNPLDIFNGSYFLYSPSLLSLDISFCNITTIPNKFFSNLHDLLYLNLRGNRLTSFYLRSVPQNLESLNISGNSLTHINAAADTIGRLDSLKYLDLTNNSFTCECRTLALWRWCAKLRTGKGGASSCEEFCPRPCGEQEHPVGGKTAPENVHTRINTNPEETDKENETSGDQQYNDVETVTGPDVISGAEANDTYGKMRANSMSEFGGSGKTWSIITYSIVGVLGGLCLIGVIALVTDGILGWRKARAKKGSRASSRNSLQNVRLELMGTNEDRQETTPLSVQHRFDYVSQPTSVHRNAPHGRSRRS